MSILSFCVTAFIFYHFVFILSRTFSSFFKFFRCDSLSFATVIMLSHFQLLVNNFFILFLTSFQKQRRKRDLNPRAAINDLLTFQASPFGLLGISPYDNISLKEAERVGFEPTRPLGQTVFKTASLWPLRYLSIKLSLLSLLVVCLSDFSIISSHFSNVNNFFQLFLKLFLPTEYLPVLSF